MPGSIVLIAGGIGGVGVMVIYISYQQYKTEMSKEVEHIPDWLSISAFNDSFDWSRSIKTKFPTLFEYVTLHDSFWQAINLNITNETILTIKLDSFWNKEYTLHSGDYKDWPFLIIKILNVLNISYNTIDFATTISNTSSVTIENDEIEKLIGQISESRIFPAKFYERLIDSKEIQKTRFDDVYGGNIEFLHSPDILILLLDYKGRYIDPLLEKTNPFKELVDLQKSTKKGMLNKLWSKLTGK